MQSMSVQAPPSWVSQRFSAQCRPKGLPADSLTSHSITAPFHKQAQIHEIRTSERLKKLPAQVRGATHIQNFACSTEQPCGYRAF